MKDWSPERIATAANADLRVRASAVRAKTTSLISGETPSSILTGPDRAVIDSREVKPGDLFIALEGERVDGGQFVADALRAGAWGVLATPTWADKLKPEDSSRGVVLSTASPLKSLGTLARAWRDELGATVIAITGSVGKTSTRDLIASLIRPYRKVFASRQNYNTEIGLPLEILAAPAGTEVLVLELAMRGFGQIAELTEICAPDVGVLTTIAPMHLECVGGTLDGVVQAKGELFQHIRDEATAVVPVNTEAQLEPYLRSPLKVVTFGAAGDVAFAQMSAPVNTTSSRAALSDETALTVNSDKAILREKATSSDKAISSDESISREKTISSDKAISSDESISCEKTISSDKAISSDESISREKSTSSHTATKFVAHGEEIQLELPFTQRHQMENALTALAAALAVGVRPSGRVEVSLPSLRGEHLRIASGATIINDCYNAGPLSMKAALEDLATYNPEGRRVAVLGDMLELGADEYSYHRTVGEVASASGVQLLVTVGKRASWMLDGYDGESHTVEDANEAADLLTNLIKKDDLLLVKGSRGVGLEVIAARLLETAS